MKIPLPASRTILFSMLFSSILMISNVNAAAPTETPTTVELSVMASASAANDLIRATLAAEESGKTPADLSKKINAVIADAMKTARSYPGVKIRSGNTATQPNYASNGKIESWTLRSELILDSGDVAAISALLGVLQDSLAISGLEQFPSPESRKKAENEAIVEAIGAFRARAKLVSDTLDSKPFRIMKLHINSQDYRPLMSRTTRAVSSKSFAPTPVAMGETRVDIVASGQIEVK